MKRQRTYLECYTKWGNICHRQVYESKNAAKKEAILMKKDEYCWSYRLVKLPDTSEFESKLEEYGWRINDTEFDNGKLYFEIEQWTEGGVDIVWYIEANKEFYRERVEDFNPSDEAVMYWNNDSSYRNAFGNISVAYYDLCNFKDKLLNQL